MYSLFWDTLYYRLLPDRGLNTNQPDRGQTAAAALFWPQTAAGQNIDGARLWRAVPGRPNFHYRTRFV